MHIYGIFEWIPYCCIVFTYKILCLGMAIDLSQVRELTHCLIE